MTPELRLTKLFNLSVKFADAFDLKQASQPEFLSRLHDSRTQEDYQLENDLADKLAESLTGDVIFKMIHGMEPENVPEELTFAAIELSEHMAEAACKVFTLNELQDLVAPEDKSEDNSVNFAMYDAPCLARLHRPAP